MRFPCHSMRVTVRLEGRCRLAGSPISAGKPIDTLHGTEPPRKRGLPLFQQPLRGTLGARTDYRGSMAASGGLCLPCGLLRGRGELRHIGQEVGCQAERVAAPVCQYGLAPAPREYGVAAD